MDEEPVHNISDEEKKVVHETKRLCDILRGTDAVLEPNIGQIVQKVVSMGRTQPLDVVNMLTDGYSGYASMAMAMCSWLQSVEDEPVTDSNSDEALLVKKDESYFLREFIQKEFDPQSFVGIFVGGRRPAWLNGLSDDPASRQLVYELSATHKNCLALDFALQTILFQGFEDEVAKVGSSLSGYFGVFHRLLSNRLKEMATAGEARLYELTEEIKESCCHSQHTYAHAQLVISGVARQPGGERFRRLAQELEEEAFRQQGNVVWRMQRWFLPPDVSKSADVASALVAEILSSDQAQAEVVELSKMYSNENQNTPPVQVIRHPRLLQVLIGQLYAPGSDLGPTTVEHYANLIAMATAAVDNRTVVKGEGKAETTSGVLDLSGFSSCYTATVTASNIMRNISTGQKYFPEELTLEEEDPLVVPAAAMGVLHCAEVQLSDPEYWREAGHITGAPAYLRLLATIIEHHPLLHPRVAEVVEKALQAMGNTKPEMGSYFLGLAMMLLQAGQVERVLSFLSSWATGADPSLVRNFVFKVLEIAGPPYSATFASAMLGLVVKASMRRSRGGHKEAEGFHLVEQFARDCSDIQFDPPLPAKQAGVLQDLQSERVFGN